MPALTAQEQAEDRAYEASMAAHYGRTRSEARRHLLTRPNRGPHCYCVENAFHPCTECRHEGEDRVEEFARQVVERRRGS